MSFSGKNKQKHVKYGLPTCQKRFDGTWVNKNSTPIMTCRNFENVTSRLRKSARG